jgi:hypothetical protein
MKAAQKENGAWSFVFDADELPRASTQVGLAELLSQHPSAMPPVNVIQCLLGLLETVSKECVSSLIDHLGVLPEPSADELSALGLTYDELGQLTPQQVEELTRKVRVVDLEVVIGPEDVSDHSQSTPFYNMGIEDPCGRRWSVGKDFIDF